MKLRLGFSPCPNDTFITHALLHGHVDTGDIEFEEVIADVENLNSMVMAGQIDVSKLSFHAYLKAREQYRLLDSGAALGYGCGPLVITRGNSLDPDLANATVALPGELTTANMLFSLRFPKVTRKRFMIFSDIENAVLSGNADAGVIIHENRFTYADKGLHCLSDLGAWWEAETGSPIPLGAFAIRRALGKDLAVEVETMLARSVQFAFEHPSASADYVRSHAQEMDPEVTQKHIETYVNDFSLSLGTTGRHAVTTLEQYAKRAGLI